MMKISLPSSSVMNSTEFVYGVATASFQIEGAAEARLPCIWDVFCQTPDKIKDNSNGNIACEHVHKWEEDIDLIESLAVNAYRFSISWPRVMKVNGTLNQEGVDFYVKLLDRLNEKNIKPFVTLYHWDLPQYLEEKGGWLNRETAFRFSEYVDLITQAFGDRVHSYATLNEPFCSAYLGYEIGIHAPGIIGKEFGKKAAHHLLLAHGLAMKVLNKNSPNTRNGIVLNFTPCYPYSEDSKDIAAANLADEHLNHWYIKPLIDGSYPAILSSLPDEEKPEIVEGDMEIIAHEIDFMGINYYTRAIYRADEKSSYVQELPDNAQFTEMGWEVYPQGFTDLLVSLNETYSLPPIYITENGAAMNDSLVDGKVNDVDRVQYFQDHLVAVHNAIEQGVHIQGYFAWSLLDNFEWAEGYVKRFGIVYVDYENQQRTVKLSGQCYRDFLASREKI